MSKKPYEKPQIVYREKIEARAGSCSGGGGKAGTSTGCSGPFVS
jgi:hypothetical protein